MCGGLQLHVCGAAAMMLSMGSARREKFPVRSGGKPQNYTREQNACLRAELEAWRKRSGLTKTAIGPRIGVSQQNVSNFLNNPRSGVSTPTAVAIAQAVGFPSPDDLFAARGVPGFRANDASPAPHDPTKAAPEAQQAEGALHARAMRVSERAIQIVDSNVPRGQFHKASWWCQQYIQQQQSLDEAARVIESSHAPASTDVAPASAEPNTRRKAAGDEP